MVALLLLLAVDAVRAQTVFSRFEFNEIPLTMASIGPDAISADSDAISNGVAADVIANCGALKGIDLVCDNGSGIYNQPSLGMTFRFKKYESRSDFFVRGGTSFYQTSGQLYVKYRTSDGGGGQLNYGPYNTGYSFPQDNTFHEYNFEYNASTGFAIVRVDGATVWSMDGIDNRNLDWSGAGNPVIGSVMDGNCSGFPFLDYAYFYFVGTPLSLEFVSFEAIPLGDEVLLSWLTKDENPAAAFFVERSSDAENFVEIGEVPAAAHNGNHGFKHTDANPGAGELFFRIRQRNPNGEPIYSETRQVTLPGDDSPRLHIWPNPAQTLVELRTKPDTEIDIFDLAGNVIFQQALKTESTQLDLSALPRGMYVVRAKSAGSYLAQKIILD